jgi:hypothetical protein
MKTIIVTCLLLLVGVGANAQDHMTSLTYGMAYPTQDTRDLITNFSWRGFGLEGRRLIRQDGHLSVGLSFNWTVLNQKDTSTVVLTDAGENNDINGAITGTQRRYINAFPFMATAHFYFGDQDQPQFYIGTGAGVWYIIQTLEIGVYEFEEKNWHLGVAPEVGFIFPAGQSSLILNVKYNYVLPSGDSVSGQEFDFTYLGINVGFAYWAW